MQASPWRYSTLPLASHLFIPQAVDSRLTRTSRRIHRELVSHLVAGGVVDLDIATSVRSGHGEEMDLRLTSARRLAENAAVFLAQEQSRVRVLNIDQDLGQYQR